MTVDVTVGIPYHNGVNPTHLDLSIVSICSQRVQPKSIHLIQDGKVSSEVQAVINKYKEIKNVKILSFDINQGLPSALNKSINDSQTTFYARMDSDDIACPNRIEKQLDFFSENPSVDILGTWAVDIDEYGDEKDMRMVPTIHENIIKYIWSCPLIHPTVMFRKESIMKVGLYSEKILRRQDYELWFRCVKSGLEFANLPEPLLKYRHTEDWFKKNNKKVIWEQVKMGWKGCRMIGASPAAYIGTSFPLVKAILPDKMVMKMEKLIKNIDPRHQKS